MTKKELKDYLEEQTDRYNNKAFITDDPVSIPHLFTEKKDIETIGFIVATFSWGNRKSILKNGELLVNIMGNEPHNFVMHASEAELADLKFVHRTFNAADLRFFIHSLRQLYTKHENGLEVAFAGENGMQHRIFNFRTQFLTTPHEKRSEKHISNPLTGSAAKRINMFLRWMVRNDKRGVDFGIWDSIQPAELYIPLDVHTGNVARKLKLIRRKQNDWKALEELMANVRKFDPADPCKYDYALFGVGVNQALGPLK